MWHKGWIITPKGNKWSHFLWKGKILRKTSLFELLYIVVFML